MKKRILSFAFALVLALGCVGCSSATSLPSNNGANVGDRYYDAEVKTEGQTIDFTGKMPLKLWYEQEAPKIGENNPTGCMLSHGNPIVNDDGWSFWSLPIGNGYFGVNVFGRTETERVQITDKTLATPWQDEVTLAEAGGLNNFSETYIDFYHKNSDVRKYKRYLDLRTAISGVEYEYEGVKYTREYFTSYPDNSLVIYLEADEERALEFTLRPTIPYEKEYSQRPGDGFSKSGDVISYVEDGVGTVELSGTLGYYGVDFLGVYSVYVDDLGVMKASTVTDDYGEKDGTIEVYGATKACIVVNLGTDYELESANFRGDPWASQWYKHKATRYTNLAYTREKVGAYVDNVKGLIENQETIEDKYTLLRNRHIEDYNEIFGRVEIDLDVDEDDFSVPTDILHANAKAGNSTRYYETLLFQFGRYITIAGSREGTMPTNLQGSWNCYDIPPWSSGNWHNLNIQMNYWAAFSTNMAETFEAYVGYNEAYMEQAKFNATYEVEKALYDSRVPYYPYYDQTVLGKDGGNGWVVGTAGNPFFINSERTPVNAAMITQLYWDYYQFTQDDKKLDKAYELLADAARYITKTVTPDSEGHLLVDYCDSPEQHVNGIWYYTQGTTIAQSLCYLNNSLALRAAKLKGIDLTDSALLATEEYSILNTITQQLDKYDPFLVGLSGQIKEFREEDYYGSVGDNGAAHRHVSQLIGGLYPGDLITSNTPAWLDACKVVLKGRDVFDKSVGQGWVHSIKSAMYARVKDAQNAYKEVQNLMEYALSPNMWTTYSEIYQYEANPGITAGMAEMLLQSHEADENGNYYMELLPALPTIWANGHYDGLVARGNFEIDLDWQNGVADTVKITSNAGRTAKIKYPSIENVKIVDSKGNNVNYQVLADGYIAFDTVKGETYTLTGFEKIETLNAPTSFAYNRQGLGDYTFTWNGVQGATKYNIYKAVGNASNYTLIDSVSSTNFTYTAPSQESNVRTTFCITAVDSNGVESGRTLCYFNPIVGA